jgi:hypothetical protein
MINDTETYNGWANRATWNAHLWLANNDYGTYLVARHAALAGSIDTAAQAVEDLCRESWGSRTPDDLPLDQVDWVHVAEALRS